MPYKTISIKLLNPTKSKGSILEEALDRYSKAFQFILGQIEEVINSNKNLSQKECLKILNKNIMNRVNFLNVEPFKDALKLDISMTLSTYFGRRKMGKKVSYPVARTFDEDIINVIEGTEKLNKKTLDLLFDKYDKKRPILFSRFDKNRDYTILQDPTSKTYYGKFYLFNKEMSIQNLSNYSDKLRYIGDSGEYLKTSRRKVRYMLFPLVTGKWQEKHLKDVENGIASPKSAELIKLGKEYYLNMKLWYESRNEIQGENFLGIVRGVNNDIFYAVSDEDGNLIKSGGITERNIKGKNRIHSLANSVIKLAKEHKCKITLENLLTRNDRLKQKDFVVPLSVGEYNLLCDFITYKSELAKLEKPIRISASSIFFRCPKCRTYKLTNRFKRDKFLCIGCGYSQELELVGAHNLSAALINYTKNKLKVYYKRDDGNITFIFRPFKLEYKCLDDEFAIEKFCAYFNDYIENISNTAAKNQRSIVQRIKLEEIRNCIEYNEIF